MCGIAGVVGEFRPGLISRMNAAQAHRGPDGAGVFEDAAAQVALGHVRLAILDLSDQAAQPMVSRDGRYVLVFNGEIYNYQELRSALKRRGRMVRSTGDTEVLLQGLEEHGERWIERLNGMFAFALWDRRDRALLIARDHLGVKPLYYAEPSPGGLIFASELKALCAHPAIRREPDFDAIQQHLVFCHASGERTAIRGIRRLLPATILRWSERTRRVETHRYWTADSHRRASNRAQAVEQLRETVRTATRRQMVSDVPVGAFLSGGLDSSLITACAAGDRPDFRCFTITWPSEENGLDQVHGDAPYARQLASRLGLPLDELRIGPQTAALLPKLIHHLDEPIADPAAIACYLISKAARDSGTTVLLSGQGADELFGGYPRYRAVELLGSVARFVPGLMRRLIAVGSEWIPGSVGGPTGATLRRVRRVLGAFDRDLTGQFLSLCAATPAQEARSLFAPGIAESLAPPDRDCLEWIAARGQNGLDALLDRDLSVYLPNHNLLYTDKMGMAVGVEARVPLLDLELVELAASFPSQWKVRGTTKAILRDAARTVIPDAIIDRPKAGFGAPFRRWLRNDLRDLWEDMTSEAAVRRRGWFRPEALRETRRRSQSGRVDLYMLQWAAITLELWARQFVDRNPADAAVTGRRWESVVAA